MTNSNINYSPAYYSGQAHARSGFSRNKNPYAPGTNNHKDWEQGFSNYFQRAQEISENR